MLSWAPVISQANGGSGMFCTILVIEDEVMVAGLIEQVLRAHGLSVITASSGTQAIECIKEVVVDWAVVDLKLPDACGLRLLETLGSMRPKPRRVVLTGYSDPATRTLAKTAGAEAVFNKPTDLLAMTNYIVVQSARFKGRRLPH